MPSIASLLPKLVADFPGIHFQLDEDFRWSPETQTVYYSGSRDIAGTARLLHELSHGLLGHTDYSHDINLLKMERDAWVKAQQLARQYDIEISDDLIQDHLDTYRDWLHARSTCPLCTATGMQIDAETYHCVACGTDWRVNEARTCGLKRYVIHKTKTPAS